MDLVTGAGTFREFLELLAAAAARAVVGAAGPGIECGVILHELSRTSTLSGTTEDVIHLLEWEQEQAEGPVSEVLAGGHPVAVLQRDGDFRWPRYGDELQQTGFASAFGMRLRMEKGETSLGIRAALAFFAKDLKAFPIPAIADARTFGGLAAKSLQMALDLFAAPTVPACRPVPAAPFAWL